MHNMRTYLVEGLEKVRNLRSRPPMKPNGISVLTHPHPLLDLPDLSVKAQGALILGRRSDEQDVDMCW
jgi:hypothetical protein